MIGVFVFYLGVFFLMFGLGLGTGFKQSIKIFAFFLIPVILIEPFLGQFIPFIPSTLIQSILINTFEFSSFCLGYIINHKIKNKGKKKNAP